MNAVVRGTTHVRRAAGEDVGTGHLPANLTAARVALSICELTMETELHVGWYLRQQGTACLARGAACDRKGTIEIGGIATLLSNSRKVVMSVRRAM